MLTKLAEACLFTLQEGGFQSFAVGGCVRDMLLGRPIHDIDIATDATPEQVIALFPHTIPTGFAHGTVTVCLESEQFEVTTFRSESAYSDGRHPDAVRFEKDITADLSRRDFTVNAMALSLDGALLDPFGGQEDLQQRLLRCVGEPSRRFAEDSLRILRAVRFAAQLDFEIEAKTLQAMIDLRAGLKAVSAERLREELVKILLAEYPQRGNLLFSLDLFEFSGDFTRFSRYPTQLLPRLAAFCRQANDASLPQRLKWNRRICSSVRQAEQLAQAAPWSQADWRQVIGRYGEATGLALAGWLDELETFAAVNGQSFVRHVSKLAVSGANLLAEGLVGEEIGAAQKRLLEYVWRYPEENERELLLAFLYAENCAAEAEQSFEPE